MLNERRSGLAESLWRAGFGAWLFVHFTREVWPAEGVLRPLGTLGMLAALCLALGWRDRLAAATLAVLWCLRPLPGDPWRIDWIVPALCLLQVCVPLAPYGALAVRGRTDPGGNWSLPGWIARWRFAALCACWVFVLFPGNGFLVDAQHAPTVEDFPAALLFAAVAGGGLSLLLRERLRGLVWLGFLVAAVCLQFETGKEGARVYLWLALAAAFQPGWIAPLFATDRDWIFYDGTCALCHGFVRFVLAEDASGRSFRFAPLQGESLRALIPEAERAGLPDSIVVRTADGRTLLRSSAALHVLARLGGLWRVVAAFARLVPRPLRDLAYTLVASVRKCIFGSESNACPMLPRHLRARFGN